MDSERTNRCIRRNVRVDSLKTTWRGEMHQGSPEGWIEPILGTTSGNTSSGIEIKISACNQFSISSRILKLNADGIFTECSMGNAVDAKLSVL